MRGIFQGALLGGLMVACSSAGVEDAESANADLEGGGPICATIDYRHDESNGSYFLSFSDDASAMAYAQGFLQAIARPPATEISHDAHLVELLDDVYRGFEKVFPAETDGMSGPPKLVVVHSSELNAFAGFDARPEVERAPWLFFVHDSILTNPPADAELKGLFAHELGHLILRNTKLDVRARLKKHHLASSPGDPDTLGAYSADDPASRARAEELLEIDGLVGRESVLGAVPLGTYGIVPQYQDLLTWLLPLRATSPNPADCTAASRALQRFQEIFRPRLDPNTYALALSGEEKTQLAAAEGEVGAALRRCLVHVKWTLFEAKVRAELDGVDPTLAGPLLAAELDPWTPESAAAEERLMANAIERQVDTQQGASTIDRILDVTRALRARADALNADPDTPIDLVRVYDAEQDSDDAAVRVLFAIGADPMGSPRFNLGMMPSAAQDACTARIAAGDPPPYGRFRDAHNDTCWRYWHGVEFARALTTTCRP